MFVRWGSALFFANVSPWMCSTSPRARQALFVHPLLREREIYIYIHTHKYICSGFGKWGYPKSSILMGFSVIYIYIYKPSVFGYHILGNIPTYIYIYIYTHTYTYIHLHTYTYIYIYTYIHTYIHI